MEFLPPQIQPVIDFWESRRPDFLWAPTSPDKWLKDQAKGLTGRVQGSAGAIQAGGIPRVVANSADSYLTFPTNCGIGGGASNFIGVMLVEIVDPTAVTGAFLKIGDTAGGLGYGGGNTTFEDSGGKAIILQEAVAWRVSASSSIFTRGLNVLAFGVDSVDNTLVNLNTGLGISSATAASNLAPSSVIQINGYTTNRGSNVRVLAVAIYAGTAYSNQLATTLGIPAVAFRTYRGTQKLFSQTRRIWVPVSAGGGITGTAASTQQPNAAAASGAVAVSGTAAATQQPNTGASTGAVSVSGTATPTQSPNAGAATGAVAVASSGAATQQLNTAASSGAVAVSGTAASTQALNTGASTGAVAATGTAASTQALNTTAATGAVAVDGASTNTQQPNTAAASGAVVTGIAGTAAATQEPNTGTATGAVGITGTAAAVQQLNTTAATGAAAVDGTAASAQQPNTAAASGAVGNVSIGSAASTQQPNTTTSTGAIAVSGDGASTQAPNVGAASGDVGVSGAAATQQPNISAIAGAVAIGGSGATTAQPDIGSGTGAVAISGSAASTGAPDIAAAFSLVLNEIVAGLTRVHLVNEEDRTYRVAAENRAYRVPSETRVTEQN